MQQGAAGGGGGGGSGQQYGVPVPVPVPSDVAQFGGGSGRPPHGHMLGISSHDQTAQHLQQQQLLQQSSHKADSLNEISQTAAATPAAQRSAASFEQLMPGSGGGFGEEEGLHGEDGERGGSVGNRWPRQETLALLKIRSEMDATFRDASLKGPLWEDVSRRLAELGYNRSAKKCKEKFENVHKYYKRTKDGRAGRQDGKSYRFFSQLEALQSSNSNNNHCSPTSNANDARNSHNNAQAISSLPAPNRLIPQPCSAPVMLSTNVNAGDMNRNVISAAAPTTNPVAVRHSSDFSGGNLSFSSDSSEEDDDYDEQTDSRKRKRASPGPSASTKNMMLFFEQLMKQVMERQEMMQQKFLETIEKREQDRMVREEAWKRQEMARLHREHDIMAQERALSASRDAAFISFLQKLTGQTFQGIPTMASLAQSTTTINPVPVTQETHEQQHRDNNNNSNNNSHNNNSQENAAGAGGIGASAEQMDITFDPSSSRWPKPEVHALIRLRSGMEPRYQDAGPKGPLWEEISAGMARLGYNRSSKRCKEKWENINKYFKKVKESNKKRPEDAKTCPYFHQLDQLYRKRILSNTNSNAIKEDQQMNHSVEASDKDGGHILAIMPPPPGPSSEGKNNGAATAPGTAIAPTNGTAFYSSPETRTGADHHRALKKPGEGLVMDVMDMDDDDEDDEDTDMQSGHQQQQREQQSIVEDYDDDKIEADDSDNNNEHDPQHLNVTTTGTSTAHDHLPFAHFVHDARPAASAPANSFMAMVHRLSATSDQSEFKTSKA